MGFSGMGGSAAFRFLERCASDDLLWNLDGFGRHGSGQFPLCWITLRRDFVKIRCSQPCEEERGRGADKVADAHER